MLPYYRGALDVKGRSQVPVGVLTTVLAPSCISMLKRPLIGTVLLICNFAIFFWQGKLSANGLIHNQADIKTSGLISEAMARSHEFERGSRIT